MNLEQAAALRKPFPPEAVGKLPKPYKRDSAKGQCNECGGYHGLPAVHLDYVGHAATTDRLLSVDPEWSWEPVGVDQFGLPAPDGAGNLWIRLTVCGVTRLGVGDGGSMKERIGDAIRNAAMRFGVALDLWSKEELEQSRGPAVHQPGPLRDPDEQPTRDDLLLNTSSGLAKRMYALINEAGITDSERLGYLSSVADRSITSSKELTEGEARAVIDKLSAAIEQPFPQEPTA